MWQRDRGQTRRGAAVALGLCVGLAGLCAPASRTDAAPMTAAMPTAAPPDAAMGAITPARSMVRFTCPADEWPTVRVERRLNDTQYDFTVSQAELSRREVDTLLIRNTANAHVGGLMAGQIGHEMNVVYSTLTSGALGQMCMGISQLDVAIIISPKIYVASEYRRGTCRFAAILRHEQMHVAIDIDTVRRYLGRVRAATQRELRSIGQIGPFSIDQEDAVRARLDQRIQQIVEAAMQPMFAERMARQQAFDSPEEYRRVANAC